MKKITLLLTFSAFLLTFCLAGLNVQAQCPDMSHPLSKAEVKKYSNNYKVLVALHAQFAVGHIDLSKDEMDCLFKISDRVRLNAASYSAFNARTLIAIVEISSHGSTSYYDLDELFPRGKGGQKHMVSAR